MIHRDATSSLLALAKWFPVLAVTGPRQSGKTTLVQKVFPDKPYVTLEDLDVRSSASADPRGFLSLYPQGAILDEVQRVPELLSYLQTVVDRQQRVGQWVLTGSQQFGLMSQITQSLAGRVGTLQLLPFSLAELQNDAQMQAGTVDGGDTAAPTGTYTRTGGFAAAAPASGQVHPVSTMSVADVLYRGFYPATAARGVPPADWYADYFASYVERDVRQLLQVRELSQFALFVRLCAARCSQLLNLSSLAADCGVSSHTAKGWLSVLEASYVCFLLTPHHQNFGKQMTKSPKLYFHDTGLAAWLLGLRSSDALRHSAHYGALFENWAVTEALKHSLNHRLDLQLHFWRNKGGQEVDLLISQHTQRHALEFKAGQTLAGDWFGSLRKYAALAESQPPLGATSAPSKPDAMALSIVYGGEQPHLRHNVQVHAWRHWPTWLRTQFPPNTQP